MLYVKAFYIKALMTFKSLHLGLTHTLIIKKTYFTFYIIYSSMKKHLNYPFQKKK